MEKKYLVVVYRNRSSLNDYNEFTDKEIAEHYYKYVLNKMKNQSEELKDHGFYIFDVRLYTLTEIGE